MISSGIRELITVNDEISSLWRTFLEELEHQGGSPHHLNRFLSKAKTDRSAVIQHVRMMIGPIWNLANNPIDLGEIDFTCPISEYYEKYRSVSILPGAMAIEGQVWTEQPPQRKCKYRLAHFGRAMHFREVLKQGVESAGYRELVAYASHVQFLDASGSAIVALGSRAGHWDGEMVKLSESEITFPTLLFHKKAIRPVERLVEVAWRGFKLRSSEKFDTSYFYLVRV